MQPTSLLGPVDLRWVMRVVSRHYCLISMPHLSPGNCHLTSVLCSVTQSCLTLCDLMNCSLPGSSVHGDSPGKTIGRVAMPSSRGSSQPWDQTQLSCIAGGFFTSWSIREAPYPVWFLTINYLLTNYAHYFLSVITRIHYPAAQMISKSIDYTMLLCCFI